MYFPADRTSTIPIMECTLKYWPPREGNTENEIFQYHPISEDNTAITVPRAKKRASYAVFAHFWQFFVSSGNIGNF